MTNGRGSIDPQDSVASWGPENVTRYITSARNANPPSGFGNQSRFEYSKTTAIIHPYEPKQSDIYIRLFHLYRFDLLLAPNQSLDTLKCNPISENTNAFKSCTR